MQRDYGMIEGIATVAEAIALAIEKDAHFLIVAKRHQDDEYGIVSVADIAKHVLAPNRAPERTNVYEIMSKPVLYVRPNMDIRYCARLFHRFGVSTAPVIEGDEIQGIVAYDQLVLKGLARQS
jgi:predicted transcriptional regulator